MSMKLSSESRCNPRATAPSDGTSRIQLSISAGRASPDEIRRDPHYLDTVESIWQGLRNYVE